MLSEIRCLANVSNIMTNAYVSLSNPSDSHLRQVKHNTQRIQIHAPVGNPVEITSTHQIDPHEQINLSKLSKPKNTTGDCESAGSYDTTESIPIRSEKPLRKFRRSSSNKENLRPRRRKSVQESLTSIQRSRTLTPKSRRASFADQSGKALLGTHCVCVDFI